MSALSFGKSLRNGSSILALSTLALIGAASSASATTSNGTGLFGGGSTLASLALHKAFDCYIGQIFTPDNLALTDLPTTCTNNATAASGLAEGLYAGVGSGSGLRGFASNDSKQLFLTLSGFSNTSVGPQTQVTLPGVPPVFVDGAGVPLTKFDVYPYPRIDFGASDSPLPTPVTNITTYTHIPTPATGWLSTSFSVTRADTVSTVGYSTASWGQPIQLPLFEAPVAVAVNLPVVDSTYQYVDTSRTPSATWTIHSQFSSTNSGGRIQLSTAQICAIFSGLVTDWSSTATIPYLKNDGTLGTQSFSDDNTYHAGAGGSLPGTSATPYVSTSTPITIVYRSDGSGTSFIFSNYLKTVCPLLTDSTTEATYKYQAIFSASNLPNNSFSNLWTNVAAAGRSVHTVGASGSDNVAAAIGTATANIGYIGYLSGDFVKPYNTASTAPASASLQNDWDRAWQVYHPGQTSANTTVTGPQNFAAPTPAGTSAAWNTLQSYGVTPAPTWTYQDYNVYAKVFPSVTTLLNSSPAKSIAGLSILPLANGNPTSTTAYSIYPAVGTAHLFLYSCYGTGADGTLAATRVSNIKGFLSWYYSSTSTQATQVLNTTGFNPLPSTWSSNINTEYLGTRNAPSITAISEGNVRGCTSVTGGAS